jgi:dTDP-4-dehydrorhamnose 3,5-epimerase-like enzyme
MGIDRASLVQLPVVADPQGNLAFAEAEDRVPFPVARVFYVYDIPVPAKRGGHAHRELEQVVFCLAGAMEVVVDDAGSRRAFRLKDPRVGLYLPPMVWHDIGAFSAGTVYMVLASAKYDEGDYIRDYEEYLATARVAR